MSHLLRPAHNGVNQPVASRSLNADWLSCCSRRATRQWPPLSAPLRV